MENVSIQRRDPAVQVFSSQLDVFTVSFVKVGMENVLVQVLLFSWLLF